MTTPITKSYVVSLAAASISGARQQVIARNDGTTCHSVFGDARVSPDEFIAEAKRQAGSSVDIGRGNCPGTIATGSNAPLFYFDFAAAKK